MIYFQGDDFKARLWCSYFSQPTFFFKTLKDYLLILKSIKTNDVIVFRYQNNPKSYLASLITLLTLFLIIIKSRIIKVKIYWICHNVDTDTSQYHKIIEKLRRGLLKYFADNIFVLHHSFIPYLNTDKAKSISFGRKFDGDVSNENYKMIKEHANKFDKVILIAGQDGGKYKHFDRVPEIFKMFGNKGLNVGFVLVGANENRKYPSYLDKNILRINERNISEVKIKKFIDFIYRENDDLSIPYTIYAASTAEIPIIVNRDNCLCSIVRESKIGGTLQDVLEALDSPDYQFNKFLEINDWDSLAKELGYK